jgi:EAL domain-containing protein (putative c-di-GMP-specific phosphodiesterase class I)
MIETKEYTITELVKTISMMNKVYDLVRLVDPKECCQLSLEDNHVAYHRTCYTLWDARSRCRECSSYQACLSGRRKDRVELYRGQIYRIQSIPIVIRQENGEEIACALELIMVHDATEAEKESYEDKEQKETGYEAIKNDPLTGLYNWEGFSQTARQMLENSTEPLDLVISEVVQYNLVEALFGSEVLDQVLLGIANICREYDASLHLFGRLQKGRYIMLVSHNTFQPENIQDGMRKVGEMLTDSMFRLQVRSGVYCIEEKEISIQEMINRALLALDKVRNAPTEVIAWFDEDMKRTLEQKKKFIRGFDQAIRDGEYHLFLKPMWGEDGMIEGAQATSCRVRSDGSIDNPADFLKSLEEAGLVAKLDRYIWERAVALLSRWKNVGMKDLLISVKVSAADFYYMDVVAVLQELVERYDVRPEQLWMEIKEKSLFSDQKRLTAELERIQKAGFPVVVDDFGKASSALSVLTQVKIHAVKLDRSYVLDVEESGKVDQLFGAILAMAEALNVRVITKGEKVQPIPVRAFEKQYLHHQS